MLEVSFQSVVNYNCATSSFSSSFSFVPFTSNHFHSTLLKDVHVTNGNGSLSVSVEQLRLHPQYSIFRTIRFPDYDMALVQTAQVLDGWTLAHSSICLPAAKLDAEITCFIGGTGGGGEFGGQNNDVAFEVKEMSHCNASQHYNGIITERTFCAERSTGREEPSACLPPYLPLLCLTRLVIPFPAAEI